MALYNQGKSVSITDTEKYTIATAYSGGNLIYVGKAAPGTAKSASFWQIMKLTYDISDNLTDIQWADGDKKFDNIWDNRASLSYS